MHAPACHPLFVAYSYTDSNWKDKLTAYDGQTITYDAIGNPLNDGRRRYEWQAGRQLKKVYVKADLKEGTKAGVDEQTGTVLKIEWSNGNLLEGEVASTQASATVTRCGEDVTEEYPASAFNWVRDSGDVEADNAWNAAHAGMKSITCTATDLNGDVKISCTLTASSATYGSITVDDDMDASHTPADLDANDIFVIENGDLKVTTSRGNAYVLENGVLKAAGAKLNGSITAETKLFASQPENMVEFSYNHNKLRAQKKVTKTDGETEVAEYMFHGELLMYLHRGNNALHFCYDKQKRPIMVEMNESVYSYIHNLQGDIVGILDSAGNLVVEYGYDAWGKPVVVRTLTTAYEALAELNPFRYRGYVWDEETELYYLQDREYNPVIVRFSNGDRYIGFKKALKRLNMFAYCGNNPTNYYDPTGKSFLNSLLSFGIAFIIHVAPDSGLAQMIGSLLPAEQRLVMEAPSEAIVAFSSSEAASDMTDYLMGVGISNADGTFPNAFKHAYWNALMTRDMGSEWAEAFANAHESWPEEDLDIVDAVEDGVAILRRDHVAMDLYYNEIGRNSVDYGEEISDEDLARRVWLEVFSAPSRVLIGLPENYDLREDFIFEG